MCVCVGGLGRCVCVCVCVLGMCVCVCGGGLGRCVCVRLSSSSEARSLALSGALSDHGADGGI